jgi:hypothetical protein
VPSRNSLALGALLLLPAPALAGPPFATDDPEPVELHHWEVYLASQAVFGRAGFAGTAPHLEVNYGAAPEIQLHVIAPLALAAGGRGPTRYGPGDLELGAKLRFLDEDRTGVQAGTFPIVTLPTGSAARGLGEGGATVLLPIWLQRSLGPWTTYGGAAYHVRTAAGASDTWFLGWEVQRRVGPLALGAEVYRETDSPRTLSGATGFSAGAILDLSGLHHLLASFGAGGGDLHAYLGWQMTFGPGGGMVRAAQAGPLAGPDGISVAPADQPHESVCDRALPGKVRRDVWPHSSAVPREAPAPGSRAGVYLARGRRRSCRPSRRSRSCLHLRDVAGVPVWAGWRRGR